MPKITLIGAGSVEFTRIITVDLVAFPELRDATISLHDIDEERLATAERLVEHLNQAAGASLAVESHLDRRAALQGADFVVNEIQVGGFDATLRDFEIPTKYGLRQTIGDTLGVGGIFRGLRTIPVIVAIANDMADVCPDALLLNYANPMAMLCWAVWEGSRFSNVVGLCHSVQNTHEQLAEMVGVPEEEIDFLTAGLNHQAFVLRFERGGESLYPLLDRAIEQDPDGLGAAGAHRDLPAVRALPHRVERAQRRVRALVHGPRRGDRALPDPGGRVPAPLAREPRGVRGHQAGAGRGPAAAARGRERARPALHPLARDGHAAARVRQRPQRRPDRPDAAGSCVEVPCRIDADGVHPIAVGSLPVQCAALNRTFLNVVELTVRAALEERRDHIYRAVLLDPNAAATLTIREVHRMVDELIDAHGELMPAGLRLTRRLVTRHTVVTVTPRSSIAAIAERSASASVISSSTRAISQMRAKATLPIFELSATTVTFRARSIRAWSVWASIS